VDHRNINDETVRDFFSPNPVVKHVFPNEQVFDFESLKGRLLSSSYVPDESHLHFPEMIAALRDIFKKYEVDGFVRFSYATKVYVGKIHPD
jgi:hypothetical protein